MNPQHQQLIDKAKSLGCKITPWSIAGKSNTCLIQKEDLHELVIQGIPASWINKHCELYCDDKQLTKQALQYLEIPYVNGITFCKPDEKAVEDFLNTPKTSFVCKPLIGTNGIGVEMNIIDREMLHNYFDRNHHLSEVFILEEQIAGQDLRLQVINSNIVAACIREPAFIIGNDLDSIEQLIENRRAEMRLQNPLNYLDIDQQTLQLLTEQSATLESIPGRNEKIFLKKISNMAQGGIATDVTDRIHPIFQSWVGKICKYLKTGYLGIDIMTTDFETNEAANRSKILELNARADWLHHTFSKQKKHDVAAMIIEVLLELNNNHNP